MLDDSHVSCHTLYTLVRQVIILGHQYVSLLLEPFSIFVNISGLAESNNDTNKSAEKRETNYSKQ